jgi:GTPase SAR1 family protein
MRMRARAQSSVLDGLQNNVALGYGESQKFDVEHKGIAYRAHIQFWDAPGQSAFHSMVRDAIANKIDAVILMYDVKHDTIDLTSELKNWYDVAVPNDDATKPTFLIENKDDDKDIKKTDEEKQTVRSMAMQFVDWCRKDRKCAVKTIPGFSCMNRTSEEISDVLREIVTVCLDNNQKSDSYPVYNEHGNKQIGTVGDVRKQRESASRQPPPSDARCAIV